jgi:hypothetical protein
MEMPGAPRALREQGRRSFGFFRAGCLKCESEIRARKNSARRLLDSLFLVATNLSFVMPGLDPEVSGTISA